MKNKYVVCDEESVYFRVMLGAVPVGALDNVRAFVQDPRIKSQTNSSHHFKLIFQHTSKLSSWFF